ncbi:MAG TPA: GEVED domain-containing protein, partial [Chitinophagaceae bacterium]|nr:GEVED domain-containing protein [Chitinophagaceae bacterium]
GVPVNFTIQNYPGTGATYQWYNNAGAIAGATNATYSQTITVSDDFYCAVDCGGNIGNSNLVTVTPNSFFNCYCASAATTTADEDISNVTFGSLNNTSGCATLAPGPGSVVSMYSNYKTLPATSVMQGQIVPLSVTQTSCGGTFGNITGVWIDYNHNGLFTDVGEQVMLGTYTSGNHTDNTNVTIPFSSTPGLTVMRVVNVESSVVSPCGTYSWGETEDYMIDIQVATPCSGAPNPGNTLASNLTPCPNQVVSFTLQNLTPGTGVTYQWFNNSGAIAGATNSYLNYTATVADDFYCEVSCSGGTPVPSNLVSISMAPFYNCYCTSGLGGSCAINSLSSVSIAGTSFNNVTSGCTATYNFFPPTPTTTATLVPGTTYSMTAGCIAGSNTQVAIWIDYNQDGIYSPSEYTLINGNIPSGGTGSGTFTVPLGALNGPTGMRVRSDWQGTTAWTPADACTLRTWGETEDYTVEIALLLPCTGTPNPGNTIASATSVCSGTVVNFSLQNASTLGAGVTFQWYNNAGPIAGATGSTYSAAITAADDYYCDVTCPAGPTTTSSNLVSVALAPFYSCYCSSLPSQTADEEIYSVTVNGASTPATYANAAGCTTVAPGPGSVLNRYSNFTPLGALTTLSLGQTVPFTVQENECDGATYFAFGTSIWIDFNQNGSFADAGEQVFVESVTAAGPRNVTGSFTIPVTALSGPTAMRITCAEGYSGTGLTPCLQYGYGETEDWVVNIAPLPMDPPSPMQANTPNCATGGELAAVGSAPPGETWYWQTSATGTSTANPATTNLTIFANGTYYIRSQSNAYLTWSAGAGSITVTNFPTGPADPTISSPANPACGSVTLISSAAPTGATTYWQGTNGTGTSTSSPADDGVTNTPYSTSASGVYYLRSQDNTSYCWSNPVPVTVTVLTVPTTPIVGANPGTICPGGSSALSAVAPSAPPTGYNVASIPYAPVSPITTSLANAGPIGDEGTTLAPLGFNFNYFGTSYSNVTVHTNGYIVFGTYAFGSYTPTPIPSVANTNGWVGYWSDLNASAGQISYATVGTAPNRMFIANYNAVPYYSATPYYSGQIVLYEATGAIDVYLSHTQTTYIGACGVENQSGTAGTAAPGQNAVAFAVDNVAWRFSPIQAMGFLWTPNGPGSGIASGNETLANTVASPSATTSYTMTITDPLNGCTNSASVTVTTLPVPPAPTVTGGATACGAGTVTLGASGTGGTLNWYATATSTTILGSGNSFTTPVITSNTDYYVEETNGTCAGPRSLVTAVITPSPGVSASSNVTYVCVGGANNQAVLTATSSNANYSYTWDPGGLTGASVTVTPTGTTTYTVTATDGICTDIATVTVNGGLVPTLYSVTASPASLCVSGTSQLAADAGEFAPTTYCTPTVLQTGVTGDYIDNFSINTLSNLASGDNPTDYALYPQTTVLQLGSTYTINAAPGTAWGQGIGVWIDFNRNGSFTDAGEFVFASPSGTVPVSGTVTIPMTAVGGKTRIRVGCHYAAQMVASEACGHTGFGEYEDYIVTLSAASGSLTYNWTPATGLSATNVSSPIATVSSTSTYNVEVSDVYGCSTNGNVTVTVNQPSSSTDNITACGSYTWAANGQTYTAAGTYTATSLNAGGCTHTSTLNLTIACNTVLNLTCFIEGYWDGISQMVPALANQGEPTTTGACDSIDVELHSDVAPYGVDAVVRTVLQQNGTAVCTFPPMTGNKYIAVKHRSALQTWSANPVAMGTTVSYDFSTSDAQAYNNNMVQVSSTPVVWAFFSGDVITDENMDLLDLGAVETDISNFGFGYLSTDLNGDGNVDLLDSPMLEVNISNFIYSNHP